MKPEHRLESLEEMVKVLRSSICYNDERIKKIYEELQIIRELLERISPNAE